MSDIARWRLREHESGSVVPGEGVRGEGESWEEEI